MPKVYVPKEVWQEAGHWIDEERKTRCPLHLIHNRGKAGLPVTLKALKRAENTLVERAAKEDGRPARKLDDLRVLIIRLIVKTEEPLIIAREGLKK